MQSVAEDSIILDKTLELCETLASHNSFNNIRTPLDRFMKDQGAMDQYNELVEMAQFLDHRQSNGTAITQDEAKNFEQKREQVMNNNVIREFLEARQQMEAVKQVIHQCVTKTFELGRKPTIDEVQEEEGGGCGSGCGCH